MFKSPTKYQSFQGTGILSSAISCSCLKCLFMITLQHFQLFILFAYYIVRTVYKRLMCCKTAVWIFNVGIISVSLPRQVLCFGSPLEYACQHFVYKYYLQIFVYCICSASAMKRSGIYYPLHYVKYVYIFIYIKTGWLKKFTLEGSMAV